MNQKRVFWTGFATLITGFLYYKINYAGNFPGFLPPSPWIGGFTRVLHINPEFAQSLFKNWFGLGLGTIFVIFILSVWGLKKGGY